jgi:hypothetical protein
MLAARAVDLEDIKNILLRNKDSIDYNYVRKWLSEFAKMDEYKQILTEFENLREI